LIETASLNLGDECLITGPTTGVLQFRLKEIMKDEKIVGEAVKGDIVSFEVKEKVRKNDKVYVLKKA